MKLLIRDRKVENLNILERVHELYWNDDKNCAITTVTILSEHYDVRLESQVIDGLAFMPGLGMNGLTCGIVIGGLTFIGIFQKERQYDNGSMKQQAQQLVAEFKKTFGSELCSVLRPEGFSEDNPPHLCENLTVKAIKFIINFIDERVKEELL